MMDPVELELRRDKLRLREREVAVKEKELRLKTDQHKWWGNPVFVGLLAAALGLFGNIGATWYQGHSAQVLASEALQHDLIVRALNTDDADTAARRLAFLLHLGYIENGDGRIEYYIENPSKLPLGPWPDKPFFLDGSEVHEPSPAMRRIFQEFAKPKASPEATQTSHSNSLR